MKTIFQGLLRRLPSFVLSAVLFGTGCGSSSTSLIAPTTQKCQISVNGFTGTFGPSGGSGSATIDAARECSWSASSQASWIDLASPAQGTGVGTLSFTVQANTAPRARSGAMSVNSQQLTVSQEPAPCHYSVAPSNVVVAAAGGAGSVSVSASDGSCGWTAASGSAWITITSAVSANGNGSVSFAVTASTGAARSGSLAVAGQSVSVEQVASSRVPRPTPTPAPSTTVQLTGDVSGKTDSCPTLSFVVQGVAVVTNADTAFVNTPCHKVRNGLRVQVDGVQQAGQPVVATRVTSLQ
jgi:hypothetical protein